MPVSMSDLRVSAKQESTFLIPLQMAEYGLSYPYNMHFDTRVVEMIDKQLLSLQGNKEFETLLNKYFGSGAIEKGALDNVIGSVTGT